MGFKQNTITVFEDNESSSIVLENKNKGSTITRTKHIIQVRFFYYVKQSIKQNHIKIEYLPKPIIGKLFNKLRNIIILKDVLTQ